MNTTPERIGGGWALWGLGDRLVGPEGHGVFRRLSEEGLKFRMGGGYLRPTG